MSKDEEAIQNFQTQDYWKPHFADGVRLSLEYVTLFDQTKLLLVKSEPPEPRNTRPIFFIPGWFSLVSGWSKVIREVSLHTQVFYFESREKASSILPHHDISMAIPQMADDLNEIFEYIGQLQELVVVASSMGGTMLFEYFSRFNKTPYRTILIGPNPEFKYPKLLALVLLNLPVRIINWGKKITRWYVVNYRLDPENEPEQVRKYEEVLDNAQPWKVKYSARQCLPYKAWELLAEIKAPIILIGASKDKLHAAETTHRVAELIKTAEYVDFESNKRSHSAEMGKYILGIAAYE